MKRIKTALASLVSPPLLCDTLGIIGLGLIAIGFGLVYAPLAPIVVGVAILALAIAMARRR